MINKKPRYKFVSSSITNSCLVIDIETLAEYIIEYTETKNKSFVFTDFFDPYIIKVLRTLLKNKKAFTLFLENTEYSYKDFFELSLYFIGHIYTPHLIKFIKETYLTNDTK